MLKILIVLISFAIFAGSLTLSAKETVRYVFDQVIDENIADKSGNGNIPSTTTNEEAWVSFKGEDALRFSKKSDVVNLPFKAFPGAKGVLQLRFCFDALATGETQTIWRVYGKDDGMILTKHRNGDLRFSYYDRSGKKWYTLACGKALLRVGKWYNLKATWDLSKEMRLFLDGKLIAKRNLSNKPKWAADSIMLLGNDLKDSAPFKGMLRLFSLNDSIEASDLISRPPFDMVKSGAAVALDVDGASVGVDSKRLTIVSIMDKATKTEMIEKKVRQPLWELVLVDKDDFNKRVTINAFSEAKRDIQPSDSKLTLRWKGVEAPDGKNSFDVTAEIEKTDDSGEVKWSINISRIHGRFKLYSILYPCIPLRQTGKAEETFLVWPYRWGRRTQDPCRTSMENPLPSYSFSTVYPGSMHFQFAFLHSTGLPGLFEYIRDDVGHYKEFKWTAIPSKKALVQKVLMVPAQRGASSEFTQPYEIRTAIMKGDWYDAARRYRQWAITRKWCANGPTSTNKRIPEWYKKTSIAMKWSTSKPNRKIKGNTENTRWIMKTFGKPVMGIWYQYHGNKKSVDTAGVSKGWFGCVWNARLDDKPFPGVGDAVKTMRGENCRLIAYLNSRIYDQSLDPKHPGTIEVLPHTVKLPDGSVQLYSKVMFEVCRYDSWWHERQLRICQQAIKELGFSGMYMDSFGRGQHFCYAKNHGHAPGGSTVSIQGMRKMGRTIKTNLKKIDPDVILSSEASIEQFVDIIDAKLLHYNIFTDCCPLWQTIYHDYQITYGRNFFPVGKENATSGLVKLSSVFHVGAQIARFRPDTSNISFMRVWNSPNGQLIEAFLKDMLTIRSEFLSFFNSGEMLRPPRLSGVEEIDAKTRKFQLKVPEVYASAWRSADGAVGVFMTNITNKSIETNVSFDMNEYGLKDSMKSSFVSVSSGGKIVSKQQTGGNITIPPRTTVGLIYKQRK